MDTSVGVGYSGQKNPTAAGKEAARKALEQAGLTKPDFVFVFATVGYDQKQLIDAIRETTSGAPLCGCSGEGIITQGLVVESNFAVGVMVIASDEFSFRAASVRQVGERAGLAGEKLAEELNPFVTPEGRALILLPDGLVFNFDPFLAAFQSRFTGDRNLPIFGGLAADNWTSQKTYQYHDDQVFSGGICGVLMSGKSDVAWGINHGCVPVGTKRTITASRGNIIYEIDGTPALEVLKEYCEEEWITQWNKASLNLCLGFKTPDHLRIGYEDFIIRYMMGKNDREGYVTIQSEVTNGTELWIARRDKDLMMHGMRAISRQIKEKLAGHKPKLVLHFECMGRGKVVLREKEKSDLIGSLQQDLGDVPWLGFYTYGEIGPISSCNAFHNFTSVVAAVY